MRLGILLIACVACGPRPTDGFDHRSWSELMQDAEQHDSLAEQHERAATAVEGTLGPERFYCGDPVLNDQLTTGGLPITTWQPCFDLEDEAAARHRHAAWVARERARADRRTAARLADAERRACAGLPEREREHSPFAHRRAIESVQPVADDGRVVGVRVEFRAVPGLTPAWLARAIECHRARWIALGRDPRMSPEDPTLVDGARIQVRGVGDRVEVAVIADAPDHARVALARARGALREETARR